MNDIVLSDILVFKTNLASEQDVNAIAPLLDQDNGIEKWNVDRDDIDHILRIESREHQPSRIIELVRSAGFYCEELPD